MFFFVALDHHRPQLEQCGIRQNQIEQIRNQQQAFVLGCVLICVEQTFRVTDQRRTKPFGQRVQLFAELNGLLLIQMNSFQCFEQQLEEEFDSNIVVGRSRDSRSQENQVLDEKTLVNETWTSVELEIGLKQVRRGRWIDVDKNLFSKNESRQTNVFLSSIEQSRTNWWTMSGIPRQIDTQQSKVTKSPRNSFRPIEVSRLQWVSLGRIDRRQPFLSLFEIFNEKNKRNLKTKTRRFYFPASKTVVRRFQWSRSSGGR